MKPTIPHIPSHKVKTEDLLLVKLDAERDCGCTMAQQLSVQQLSPEVGNVCKSCEARNILWKIESLKKRA